MTAWDQVERDYLKASWARQWPKGLHTSCPHCGHNGAFDHVLVHHEPPLPKGALPASVDTVADELGPGGKTRYELVECRCGDTEHDDGATGCGRRGNIEVPA